MTPLNPFDPNSCCIRILFFLAASLHLNLSSLSCHSFCCWWWSGDGTVWEAKLYDLHAWTSQKFFVKFLYIETSIIKKLHDFFHAYIPYPSPILPLNFYVVKYFLRNKSQGINICSASLHDFVVRICTVPYVPFEQTLIQVEYLLSNNKPKEEIP